MMRSVSNENYGKQFHAWYDRIFQDAGAAQLAATKLAKLHPDLSLGTLEFGVGTGRIARPLSRQVGRVDGVDCSPDMLLRLEEATAAGDEQVVPICADVRTYRSHRQYGLVYAVCGTMNQILTRDEQEQVMRRAADLLVRGGRLVIESHHRPAVVNMHSGRRQVEFFVAYAEPGTGIHIRSILEPRSDLWECIQTWRESDGSVCLGAEYSLLTTASEMHDSAISAGLTPACPESGFGDWHLEAADDTSPMMITMYEKLD